MELREIKTYCINLEDRPERWEEVQEEVKKIDIEIERYPGIKWSPGWQGCLMTHKLLLELCRCKRYFMIIEDDILFLKGAKENLESAISQLPDNWDMLYLGATLNKPLDKVDKNLLRLKRGWATHGIIYNNQHGVADFILDAAPVTRVDEFIADDVQEKFNCFMCYPMVATQRPGHSDVVNRYQPYTIISNRYKKYVEKYHGGNIFEG